LDIDIGVDNVGVVFEVVGVLEDVFVGVVVGDFDVDIVRVDGGRFDGFFDFVGEWGLAFQAWLFSGLFGAAFWAGNGFFAEVEEACAAGDAGMFFTEFRLGHLNLEIVSAQVGRRDAMPLALCQTGFGVLIACAMESVNIRPLVAARPVGPLRGEVAVPGDKSISHRALMFGALAVGETRITGLLEGEDVRRTAAAMRALGAEVWRDGADWLVAGRGIGGLTAPEDVLDMGNSGTAARLLAGILASHDIFSVMTGDASLRKRPMRRVIEPLRACGAVFSARPGERLPMSIQGARDALPISYRLPVASAQVKSAVLLAGLNARGVTEVEEPEPTRDHSENMLRHFGAALTVEKRGSGRVIRLVGQPELRGADVAVPGDPSSASFPIAAGLLVPGSRLTITGVGLNPLRTGLFETLREMGADLTIRNPRVQGGESIGDAVVEYTDLIAVDVPPGRAPSMIDEYPVLAVVCAFARGVSRLRGLSELRVKESDRLAATAAMLREGGVHVEIEDDDLIVHGGKPAGGGLVLTHMDHRLAMSALVFGQATASPMRIDDSGFIETSFPGFVPLMRKLGAAISAP
jgi:3-phosphoshikimate 1-carboxyvinyltransferase